MSDIHPNQGLILPWRIHCPRGDDAVHRRSAGPGVERYAERCRAAGRARDLPAIPGKSFFEVGVGHGADCRLGVGVRSLQRGDDFCFFGRGLLQSLCVHVGGSGSSHKFVGILVGGTGVQENFGNVANVWGRAPRVFVGRYGFGETNEFAFLDHDFCHDFRAVSCAPGVPSRYGYTCAETRTALIRIKRKQTAE
jgi:hypothetical protein